MKFELKNSYPSIANALRRVMIGEVPTIAINLVEIESNSSVLNNEFLAHMLDLIPLISERAMDMRFSRECDTYDEDTQFQYCSVEFKLNMKCDGDQTLDVTSLDIVSSDMRDNPIVAVDRAADMSIFDASEQRGIIIVKL